MSARRTKFPKNIALRDQRREIDALLLQANADRLTDNKNLVADLDAELTPDKLSGISARKERREMQNRGA